MLEFLLFDLDDTLFDFRASEKASILKAMRTFGIPDTEENARLYSEINDSLWKALERGEVTRTVLRAVRMERFLKAVGHTAADAGAFGEEYEENLSHHYVFFDGAEELLQKLQKKYRLFLLSNGLARTQNGRLAASRILQYFEGYFISETLGVSKPSKAFFDAVFSRIEGFSPERAVMIGDSLSSDILGGKNAGVKTVWFNPRRGANKTEIFPDKIYYEVSALPDILEQINQETMEK